MTWLIVPALLAGACVPAEAQERDAFVLLLGDDTVSVERFERTAERLESELFIRIQNARMTFSATLRPDGTVSRFESAFRSGDADRASPPTQRAVITWEGDTAVVEITGGGRTVTQRLASTAGAIPYINPSFALMELILARARAMGGSRVNVPVFTVQGGVTIPFTVEWVGEDSAVVTAGGVPTKLSVDARSRILGGTVPSQGVRIVRERSVPDAGMTAAPRDYTAPPGAPYAAEEVSVPTTAVFPLAAR